MGAPSYPVLSAVNLPFGSRVLTIDAIEYIAEQFQYEQPSVTAERSTQVSAPGGFALNAAARVGSAQLQLALTTTAVPLVGHTFEADTFTFVITNVGKSQTQNGFTVLPIQFRQNI